MLRELVISLIARRVSARSWCRHLARAAGYVVNICRRARSFSRVLSTGMLRELVISLVSLREGFPRGLGVNTLLRRDRWLNTFCACIERLRGRVATLRAGKRNVSLWSLSSARTLCRCISTDVLFGGCSLYAQRGRQLH